MHSNSYTLLATKHCKAVVHHKSSKQFASVSPASIPDSCAFYRLVINQKGLLTEKEGHNMQTRALDPLKHNCAHEHMGKWKGDEWADQWVVVTTKQV